MSMPKFAHKLLSYKALAILTVPAAVLVSAGLVTNASTAALSASASDVNNTWTANAPVHLALNQDVTQPLFNSYLSPGDSESHCITMTNNSTAPDPATIKMWASDVSDFPLSDQLQIKVERGSGGTNSTLSSKGDQCPGFTPAGPAFYDGPLRGLLKTGYVDGFDPTPMARFTAVQYKVTATLPANATGNEGYSTQASFAWEIQQ